MHRIAIRRASEIQRRIDALRGVRGSQQQVIKLAQQKLIHQAAADHQERQAIQASDEATQAWAQLRAARVHVLQLEAQAQAAIDQHPEVVALRAQLRQVQQDQLEALVAAREAAAGYSEAKVQRQLDRLQQRVSSYIALPVDDLRYIRQW